MFSPSDGQVMIDHGPEGDQEERHLASGSRGSSHHSFSIDIGRVGDCFYFRGEGGDSQCCMWWLPGADFFNLNTPVFLNLDTPVSEKFLCLMLCVSPDYTAWRDLVCRFNQCKQCSSSASTMQAMQFQCKQSANNATRLSLPRRQGIIHH